MIIGECDMCHIELVRHVAVSCMCIHVICLVVCHNSNARVNKDFYLLTGYECHDEFWQVFQDYSGFSRSCNFSILKGSPYKVIKRLKLCTIKKYQNC